MEGKLTFTIIISGDGVTTNMSADKVENMEITKQMQVIKACTDTEKRIKRILGIDMSTATAAAKTDVGDEIVENTVDNADTESESVEENEESAT